METLKFETIKRKAEAIFIGRSGGWHNEVIGYGNAGNSEFLALLAAITGERPIDPMTILNDWRNQAIKLIRNWDIRMVRKLVGLFPACVRKHLHGKSICCDYNEEGDWVVIFN